MIRPWRPKSGFFANGKYRIDGYLGKGGMGIVYAATHLKLEKEVALKLLRPSVIDSSTATRFLNEARNATKVSSRFAVQVLDVDRAENDIAYIVMERLKGADLGKVLSATGAVGVQVAVDYVIQACSALAQAHRRGIIHRDIKPSNLFLTQADDEPQLIKVLDFGISKCLESQDGPADLTRTRRPLGSPPYMSPEQIQSPHDVDALTDVWSLGVVLYELLSGLRPFNATSPAAYYAAILHEEPATLLADVPDSLRAAITRCLMKDPGKRFSSVRELGETLAEHASPVSQRVVEEWYAKHRDVDGRTPIPPMASGPLPDEDSLPSSVESLVGQTSTRSRTHRPWSSAMGWGVLAATALCVGVTLWVMRVFNRPPSPKPITVVAASAPQLPSSSAQGPTPAPPEPPTNVIVVQPAPPESVPNSPTATLPNALQPGRPPVAGVRPASAHPSTARPVTTSFADPQPPTAVPGPTGESPSDSSAAIALGAAVQQSRHCGAEAGPTSIRVEVVFDAQGAPIAVDIGSEATATKRGQCVRNYLLRSHAGASADASRRATTVITFPQ